jgi:hypothetical protein
VFRRNDNDHLEAEVEALRAELLSMDSGMEKLVDQLRAVKNHIDALINDTDEMEVLDLSM